ncbi:hypothetical protein EPN42_01465 [bacterium]|nr:MAG: hypothetical protein EPN42_01465 [bacterium]
MDMLESLSRFIASGALAFGTPLLSAHEAATALGVQEADAESMYAELVARKLLRIEDGEYRVNVKRPPMSLEEQLFLTMVSDVCSSAFRRFDLDADTMRRLSMLAVERVRGERDDGLSQLVKGVCGK